MLGGGEEVLDELGEPFILQFNLVADCSKVDGFALAMVKSQQCFVKHSNCYMFLHVAGCTRWVGSQVGGVSEVSTPTL